jgi:hypothetical protein
MSGHFETLLGNIVSHPDTPIKTLEMLSETEKQQQILEQEQRKKAKFNKFKSVKPKAVSLASRRFGQNRLPKPRGNSTFSRPTNG